MSRTIAGYTVKSADGASLLRVGWGYAWAAEQPGLMWVPLAAAHFGGLGEPGQAVLYSSESMAQETAAEVGGVAFPVYVSVCAVSPGGDS